MSCENYTDTLVGWINHAKTNHGPTNVNGASQIGMTFATARDGGVNFANAGDARTWATNALTVAVSDATDADANGDYTIDGVTGHFTNANGWYFTFDGDTDTWKLFDDQAAEQASGTGIETSPSSVETWAGTEDGITVELTGAGWTISGDTVQENC